MNPISLAHEISKETNEWESNDDGSTMEIQLWGLKKIYTLQEQQERLAIIQFPSYMESSFKFSHFSSVNAFFLLL